MKRKAMLRWLSHSSERMGIYPGLSFYQKINGGFQLKIPSGWLQVLQSTKFPVLMISNPALDVPDWLHYNHCGQHDRLGGEIFYKDNWKLLTQKTSTHTWVYWFCLVCTHTETLLSAVYGMQSGWNIAWVSMSLQKLDVVIGNILWQLGYQTRPSATRETGIDKRSLGQVGIASTSPV